MSDDSFFREVNEEIRQARVQQFWKRFGRLVIAGAVLVVVAAVGLVIYESIVEGRQEASGDRYLQAAALEAAGQSPQAIEGFEALARDGYGVYPDLAQLRLGGIRQANNDLPGALQAFDAVANDADAPQPLRDAAAIRAAYILVDTGSRADVSARVERLSGDAQAMRFPAREALALAAWKEGDRDGARTLFQQIADDPQVPNGLGDRAQLMLDVIAASTPSTAAPVRAPTAAPAPAAEPAPAPAPAPAEALPAPTVELPTTLPPAVETPAPAVPEAPVAEPNAPAAQTPAAPVATPPVEAPATEPAPAAAAPPAAPAQPATPPAEPGPATPAPAPAPAN
ncbi:tetratricopeptide repeat protein [Antarcticirhabdus aurantiaca]|uniref:Tetratricopeptide repeat protein n=1 Tax=Antarcticirhabdus aurantiaca TaxID=2606717 RepID=A0ACD4NJ19_9HYPH|nr:tetratricopeptide repeat protein [Antarcticirhabdus aurantiaca]WAJ26905.1 tetratricopeptide repeat protein [Jeongeuplla avenae]